MALTLSEEDFAEIAKIVRTALMTAPAPQAARPAQAAGGTKSGVLVPFGRNRGMPIEETDVKDLEYLIGAQRRSIADPSKAQYREKNETVLMACETELAKRGHAVAQPYRAATSAPVTGGGANGGGPESDDVPFVRIEDRHGYA